MEKESQKNKGIDEIQFWTIRSFNVKNGNLFCYPSIINYNQSEIALPTITLNIQLAAPSKLYNDKEKA